jgi:type IV secretory pathway TrbD component
VGAYHEVVTVQTRLVIATLCVFNGVILLVLGLGVIVFVDGAIRFGLGGGMWIVAAALFVLARRLRDDVEWR